MCLVMQVQRSCQPRSCPVRMASSHMRGGRNHGKTGPGRTLRCIDDTWVLLKKPYGRSWDGVPLISGIQGGGGNDGADISDKLTESEP